jgi:hypothetical protein
MDDEGRRRSGPCLRRGFGRQAGNGFFPEPRTLAT